MQNSTKIITEALKSDIKQCTDSTDAEQWAVLGLHIGFHLYKMIKPWQYRFKELKQVEKSDGSPTSELEFQMEQYARAKLKDFYPDAQYIGEESGEGGAANGRVLFVIDPVDGTRSFLSGFSSYSITLAILNGRNVLFSLICIPTTGEFAFRVSENNSAIFTYAESPGEIDVHNLPIVHYKDDEAALINIHPSVDALAYVERLYDLWYNKEISLIRSVSGSPALLMLEAARTGTFYLNTWSKSVSKPFDLIAPLHIVEGADAKAINLDRTSIDPWNHKGVYMVGPNSQRFERLLMYMPNDKLLF